MNTIRAWKEEKGWMVDLSQSSDKEMVLEAFGQYTLETGFTAGATQAMVTNFLKKSYPNDTIDIKEV